MQSSFADQQARRSAGLTGLVAVTMALVLVTLSALTSAPSDAQAPAPAIFTSADAVAPRTVSSCAGQAATSAVGMALRSEVATQDDPWRSAAAAGGAIGFEILTIPDPLPGHPADLAATTSGLVVSVSKRDLTPTDRDSDAPGSIGTLAVGGLPMASAFGTSGGASTLQDCAPRPADLYGAGAPPMWNATGGNGSTLDAAYFEFSQPVEGFGAWFGDLETRTDGDGQPAVIKLFDAAGAVIYRGPVPPSTPDQTACGGTSANDLPGCGNQSTRWIGFYGVGAAVSSMLVIVGDDDPCNASASGCTGFAESLSWIGATVLSLPDPTPTPTMTPVPPTATPVTPTPVPPTATPVTPTPVPPTATPVPPTATAVPPTATPVTPTPVSSTATPVPPTATAVPPTATPVTPTPVSSMATPVPPTTTPTAPPSSTPTPQAVVEVSGTRPTFVAPTQTPTPSPAAIAGGLSNSASAIVAAPRADAAPVISSRPLAVTGSSTRPLSSAALAAVGIGAMLLGLLRTERLRVGRRHPN